MANKTLTAAKKTKNDEFYTQLSDVERELVHYRKHFKGKIVFCNCDDPYQSAFWQYFHLNFSFLGLKKLIATHYDAKVNTYKLEYEGGNDTDLYDGLKTYLRGNGDFRSPECVAILQEADIVVTNPPFSLFREYVAQLMEYQKQFLIIGNQNAITYREIFPLIMDNKAWLGVHSGDMAFRVPKDSEPRATRYWVDESGQPWRSIGNAMWLTNLDHAKRHEPIDLIEHYTPEKYPTYDNYDAINVDKTLDIPMDYDGVMGVPITMLQYYCPEQFNIVGEMVSTQTDDFNHGYPYVNGKRKYARILIQAK